MANLQAKPKQALARRNELSTSSTSEDARDEKLKLVVSLLAKLGIRRQAKLSDGDYLVMAEDLVRSDGRDIRDGLDDIAKYPRREGETAFPEVAVMKRAIGERRLLREAGELQKQEADEAVYRSEHPEEFVTWKEVLESPEAQGVLQKIDMAKRRNAPAVGGKQ